jgi:hypothetical protein
VDGGAVVSAGRGDVGGVGGEVVVGETMLDAVVDVGTRVDDAAAGAFVETVVTEVEDDVVGPVSSDDEQAPRAAARATESSTAPRIERRRGRGITVEPRAGAVQFCSHGK